MIVWWFGFIKDTKEYKLWVKLSAPRERILVLVNLVGSTQKLDDRTNQGFQHPRDHVFSDWEGPRNNDSTYIGGVHLVHEKIGGELQKLKIRFKDPGEYFGADWKTKFAAANIGAAICGRVADWNPDADTAMDMAHLIHLVEDTDDGCRMRSRFWIGDVSGLSAEQRRVIPLPVSLEGLVRHASEEMAILAGILPDLYAKHGPS